MRARPRFRKAAGLGVSLGGVILAIGAASGGTDPLRPLAHFVMTGSGQQIAQSEMTFIEANSTPQVEQAIASANGRPDIVYFTADWCVICKEIERDVFSSTEIVAALNDFSVSRWDSTRTG